MNQKEKASLMEAPVVGVHVIENLVQHVATWLVMYLPVCCVARHNRSRASRMTVYASNHPGLGSP